MAVCFDKASSQAHIWQFISKCTKSETLTHFPYWCQLVRLKTKCLHPCTTLCYLIFREICVHLGEFYENATCTAMHTSQSWIYLQIEIVTKLYYLPVFCSLCFPHNSQKYGIHAIKTTTMQDALKKAKRSFPSLMLQEEKVHLFLFYFGFWTIGTKFSQMLMTTTNILGEKKQLSCWSSHPELLFMPLWSMILHQTLLLTHIAGKL